MTIPFQSASRRYCGKGCLTAVKHVNEELRFAIEGMCCMDQKAIDEKATSRLSLPTPLQRPPLQATPRHRSDAT